MSIVALFSQANAGKTVNCRWGHVTFNAAGESQANIPDDDLPKLDELGWRVDARQLREDQVEALHVAEAARVAATQAPKVVNNVLVFHHDSAKKRVKTRWGVVEFDEKGYAEVSLPDADQAKLSELGWSLVPLSDATDGVVLSRDEDGLDTGDVSGDGTLVTMPKAKKLKSKF